MRPSLDTDNDVTRMKLFRTCPPVRTHFPDGMSVFTSSTPGCTSALSVQGMLTADGIPSLLPDALRSSVSGLLPCKSVLYPFPVFFFSLTEDFNIKEYPVKTLFIYEIFFYIE